MVKVPFIAFCRKCNYVVYDVDKYFLLTKINEHVFKSHRAIPRYYRETKGNIRDLLVITDKKPIKFTVLIIPEILYIQLIDFENNKELWKALRQSLKHK